MAGHFYYLYSSYFVPVAGFFCGILIFLAFFLVQLILSRISEEDFVRLHINKSAQVLLGNFVSVRNKKNNGDDHAVIIHEFAFRKGFAYIVFSEFMLVGSVLFFTLGKILHVSEEACNGLNSDADCYTITGGSHLRNCSEHLQEGTTSDLVCYRTVLDFGTGLAVLGGSLYFLPLVYSFITGFIVSYSNQGDYPWMTGVLQTVLVVLLLILTAGISLALSSSKSIFSPQNFMDVLCFFLFILTTVCMPWCFMDRDESKVYVDNLTESYENIPEASADNKRKLLNRRRNPYGHY